MIAQTLTAGAQAVADSIGWGGLAGIGASLLGITLAYLRGVRLLAPIVAAIEWFRSHGARSLDLSRSGLPLDQQERVRSIVQAWLWSSLRDAVMQFADQLGLLAAVDKRVQAITGPLKPAEGKAAPVTIEETVERVKRTTGVMAAFRPEELRPDGLPKLALLPLALALLLGAGGCISAAAHNAALAAQESGAILRKASVANPAYDAKDREAYERLWGKHEDALRALADETR